MMSEVKKAENIGQLRAITEKYLALGYDPDQVNGLTAGMAAMLTGTQDFTDTGVTLTEEEKRRNGGGRAGLGTIYATIK